MKSLSQIALALGLPFTLLACGSESQIHTLPQTGTNPNATPPPESSDAAGQPFNDAVQPPRDYYNALFAQTLQLVDAGAVSTGNTDPQTLFVNFNGASVTQGVQPGQSFLLCNPSATIPPSDLSPADQQSLVQEVQQLFTTAGTSLNVTQTQPTSGNFTTINVGGAFSDLGCTGTNVQGVAPLDPGNANPNDVGFVFGNDTSTVPQLAQTVAHVAGHTFGCRHSHNPKDVMFAGVGTGTSDPASAVTGFIDSLPQLITSLGSSTGTSTLASTSTITGTSTSTSTSSNLPGLSQITSIGQLLPGVSNVQNISGVLPQVQSLLPASNSASSLPGLDQILTLIASGALDGSGGSGSGSTASSGSLSSLPDLASLLGLGSNLGNGSAAVGPLLQNLLGSANVVGSNFSSANAPALTTLLKVAYAQELAQILGSLP